MELSPAEKQNLDWLYLILARKEYTTKFRAYAFKNIKRFEKKLRE